MRQTVDLTVTTASGISQVSGGISLQAFCGISLQACALPSLRQPACLTAITAALLLLTNFWAASAADIPTDLADPKSPAAKKAKAEFDAATQKLDEEHATKLKELRAAYVEQLEIARKAALDKSDLDEAQRILAVKAAIQEAESAKEIPIRGFKIIGACWGAKSSWADVTVTVRKSVKDSRLKTSAAEMRLPDPAPGVVKTLVVIYSLNGRLAVAAAGEAKGHIDIPPR